MAGCGQLMNANNHDYTSTERGQRFRGRRRAAGLAVRAKAKKPLKPFMGVDGEGAGRDALGRQHYMLLRAGERELFTGSPLSTVQCLEFLCGCEPGVTLVAFAFGYDVTQILRDLPVGQQRRLFADKAVGEGHSRYTYFRDYGIDYLAKNYFRVCRTERYWTPTGEEGRRRIKGTARTVYDTFGFFQMSFLKALQDWSVGTTGQRAAIEASKQQRGDDDWQIGPIERDYCGLECDLLATMMERFREVCHAADIRPRTWNGAGKLSAALHGAHETLTAASLALLVPGSTETRPGVLAFANAAYYGGRFEVTRTGVIQAADHAPYGPNRAHVYEYDIRSAYPAMMLHMPCLVHGKWTYADAAQLRRADADPAALFVAQLRFRHDRFDVASGVRANLWGLPVRQKTGRLFWPYEATGTYWSPELRSAQLLGCRVVRFHGGWLYEKCCDCVPFSWVERLYEYRREIGSDARGKPIKLGINGLYGKLAQRIGNPRFANLIWAGLITAMTRAALNTAIAADREAVVMLATDAVFSLRPLDVPIGETLGAWEASAHERLFVMQPGIYWGAKKPKTRGVPVSFFADKTDRFEAAWADFAMAERAQTNPFGAQIPVVALPVTLFVGLKLALARGKPDTAGRWVTALRQFNFDWKAKREPRIAWETPDRVWHYPPLGGPLVSSYPHGGDQALMLEMDLDRAELDDQPDHFDITPPWTD